MLCIFRRSASNNGFKVFDEVRLIGISQLQYHSRPIYHFAFCQSFSHFVESIAFDHPLRTDTDILPEEPLQRPFVEVEPAHYVINFGDLSMSDDTVNDLVNDPDMLILLRKSLVKEIFRKCYHLSFVLSRENRFFQCFAIDPKGIPKTDGTIRKLRNRRFHKGVKAALPILDKSKHGWLPIMVAI